MKRKTSLRTLNLIEFYRDPGALTFGRKRVAPPKKESISAQHSTVKRPVHRKRIEDEMYRASEGEKVHRGE